MTAIPFAFWGAGGGGGGGYVGIDVDFSSLANGGHSAASFLSATGLTFARATGSATVQTSASALTSGIAADYARVGSIDGSSKGLVLEPGNKLDQGVGYDPRGVTGGGINAGTAARTASAATGPDGTASAATQFDADSGEYAHYFGPITDGAYAWSHSSWQRSVTTDPMQQVYNVAAATDTGRATTSSGGTTWRRIFTKVRPQSGNNKYATPVDARNYASVGGAAATQRYVYVDYYNLPRNVFPMEAVIIDQDADELSHSAVEDVISSGEMNIEFAFRPLHDAEDPVYHNGGSFGAPVAQTYYYLWRVDSTHYCRIVAATMKVEIKNGGSTFTSTYALDWKRDDLVELFVECGDGGTPTVTARINSGSPFTLGGSGTIGSFSSTGQVDLCCDTTASTVANDYSVVTARHVRLKSYETGDAPAWISGASSWTPALLSLSLWTTGSYGGEPWNGEASLGASAANGDLTQATGSWEPSVGAAVNGVTTADFDGSDDYLENATDAATLFGASEGTILGMIYGDTAAASTGSIYDDAPILRDSNADHGVTFTTAGLRGFAYDGAYKSVAVAAATGAWHAFMMRRREGKIGMTVDSGAESTADCETTTVLTGTVLVGYGYGGTHLFDGKIAELAASTTAISKIGFLNFKAWCNAKYSLSM